MSRRINPRHNRARLAERAGITRNMNGPATNPAARVLALAPGGNVRNRKAVKMTGAQRDSTGSRSAWAESPDFWTDPKWDQTVTSPHVGTGGFR